MARTAAGIDIGGTGLKIGLVRLDDGSRLGPLTVIADHADGNPARIIEQIALSIREQVARAGLQLKDLAGVGIGCAGLIDSLHGILNTSPNLPAWRNVPIRDELAAHLPVRVRLINDAAAFLAAEWLAGAAQGVDDLLIVTLGTGVGGGLILGGLPYRGSTGLGGEFGHMTIDHDGPACPCGNRGCLERFVARDAIEQLAIDMGLAAEGADNPKRVFERAEAGDERARDLYAEVGRRLGIGLAGLVNLLEPRLILLGGGIATAHAWIIPAAERELAVRSMVARQNPVPIRPARFGSEAGVVGAALVAGHDDARFG